ncbi:MAG: 6-aminohexanoate-dimer [Geobacteraceae bacterium]|nr:MAG: 6-aminohexanoate-dimer [Geobacteraceae bacterium]
MVSFFFLVAFLCCSAGCTKLHSSAPVILPEHWPTEGWRTATPESQGFDSGALARALDSIQEQRLAVHSLSIIRHGRLILDAYFYPFSNNTRHDVASVTKSITSSLVGIAIDQGQIGGVDRPVLDFFPERTPADLDEDKKAITIENLLSMSSGLNCGYAPKGASARQREAALLAMRESGDWVQFVLDIPMAAMPGTEFAYCSGNTHLLSAIISRATGSSTLDFARQRLFEPLGIRDVFWPADPQGITHGWGDLQMHPRDMAKIGYLYLNKGWWDGRLILSTEWVERSTQKQIADPVSGRGYGYGWWLFPGKFSGLYEAAGRGGQFITVWPEKDLLLVITAGGFDRDKLAPLLLAALKSDELLPENPDDCKQLQERIEAVTKPPLSKPVPPLPATARSISGKTWQMDASSLGIKELSLSFDGNGEARFGVVLPEGRFTLPVGLDGVYRMSPSGPSGLPVALKGFWQADNEFVLEFNEVGRINNFTIRMMFQEDTVAARITEGTGLFDLELNGKARVE